MATASAKPALLRTINDRRALSALLDHGVLTRARIAELCGLSKQTSSQLVQRLEADGFISPTTRVSGGRGPDAVGYSIVPDRALGVAIDAREDGLTSVVVDARGSAFPIAETVRTGSALDEVTEAIAAACAAADVDRAKLTTVVIGLPGSFDPATDTLRFADTYPGWPAQGLSGQLRELLGCEVVLDNDVKFAAIAERVDGVGADEEGFALLWMGEGLGLAVDLAGTIIRGVSGAAGEVGYIPVQVRLDDGGAENQTLQDVIGGPAIGQLARNAGAIGTTDAELFAALSEHPEALDILASRIALGVAPVLAVIDPGLLVLGGPVGVQGGSVLAALVAEQIAVLTHWRPRVSATGVSEHPVLRGTQAILQSTLRSRLLDGAGAVD